MTLLEALRQLAVKFPEKWKAYSDGLYQIDSKRLYARYFDHLSTEDCDRILAAHGLVMWVEPSSIVDLEWHGHIIDTTTFPIQTRDAICNPTKRAATEAAFLAALEYILKDKP